MPKKTKTLESLEKAVRSYNQKINRAVKSGKIPFEARPVSASLRQIKKETEGMTPKQRYAYYKAWEKELRQIQNPGALTLAKTDGGILVTEYEIGRVKRQTRQAKRRDAAEQKRAVADAQNVPQIGGVPLGDAEGRSWSKQHRIPMPHAKDRKFDDFEARVRSLTALGQHALGGEWAEYRAELVMNIEKNYGKATAQKFKRELSKITNASLERAYHEGAEFADQDFHYDVRSMENSRSHVRAMIAKMSTYQ